MEMQIRHFDNVPAFVAALNLSVTVQGLGELSVDVAWGGMWYALVDAAALGLAIENWNGPKLVELGERTKRAVHAQFTPVHPDNPRIKGVSAIAITEPMEDGPDGKVAKNTVIVSPGRFDRSPCGTGTCGRMAVLHARGQLGVGETFRHRSIIGTEFVNRIRGTTKVGDYEAVLPTVRGRAWITSFKQGCAGPNGSVPRGFRVGDQWHVSQDPE